MAKLLQGNMWTRRRGNQRNSSIQTLFQNNDTVLQDTHSQGWNLSAYPNELVVNFKAQSDKNQVIAKTISKWSAYQIPSF
jgi:hypothetical protein